MTSRDFCYWLQGYLELADGGLLTFPPLNVNQLEKIRNHLNMVFVHEIDPSFGDKKKQDLLSQLHMGGPTLPPQAQPRC